MNKAEVRSGDAPLVSVILCFHHETNFLREAVDSVLCQTHRDWELLLVDDGSSPESTAIARDYETRHPGRVTYIEHPYHQNRGLSASRNAGIAKCNGSFVAFLDADDVWLPGKLEAQLRIFRDYPEVTVLLEASTYWWSWNDPDAEDTVVRVGAARGIYRAPQLMLSLYPLGPGAAPCPSGIMVRRAVLRRCAFEELFRGVLQMYEDQAFLSKVYLREVVYVSDTSHNKYRQRPDSLVAGGHQSGNYHQVRSYYLYWFRDYLRQQPVRYKAVERLLRRAQMPYREPVLYKLTIALPKLARKFINSLLARFGILNYSKSW